VLWAPADGDHLYWMRAQPDLDGHGLFLAPPRTVGEGEVLIAGERSSALVLARRGAERALVQWSALDGRTAIAPELGPAETFAGEGLASAQRALFASTRGLYLLDRTRELYLLDYARLDAPGGAEGLRGASIHARDAWVCVLAPAGLWTFRCAAD
jgi:hypothetical protein